MNNFSSLTPGMIAEAMGFSEGALWKWARDTKRLFKPPREELVKGKSRTIEAPRFWTKKRFRRLHKFFQNNYPGHRNAHGGVRRRSCFTGAEKHCGRNYIVVRDISKCYPNVKTAAIKERLFQIGFRYDTAVLLAKLSTVDNHLPQGSPISSDILNLFLYDADEMLARNLEKLDVSLHRCYDDVVASSDSRESARLAGEFIEAEIIAHDLKVNEKKRADNGFQPRKQRQTVHNLVVSNPGGIAIRKEDIKKATMLAESYVRGAKSVSADTLEVIARKRQKVLGYICHFEQAKFSNAKHLRKLLQHGDRHIKKVLFNLGLNSNKWYVKQGNINTPEKLAKVWRKKLEKTAA